MHLLVTTSQSFLLVDTDSNESISLDSGHGLYYGIARAGGQLFVAARNRLVSSTVAQTDEQGEILIFDRALQLSGSLQAPFPFRDLHEIAWYDNKLWAVCSYDNLIAVWDGIRWEQWFPLGGSLEGPGDMNHFNSFMFDQGRIWLLAHNRGASELLAFSASTRELVERVALGSCAHNMWLEKNQLFTCSSSDGQVRGNRGFVLETGGFPRGVAFDEKCRCVGVSELAERKARDFTAGKLMLFDREWKFQKEIVLYDEGLILDMQCLPDGFRPRAATKTKNTLQTSPPNPIFERISSLNTIDANTMNDTFYRRFEDRHRGSRAMIKSRLRAYLPFVKPLGSLDRPATAIDLGCGRGEWLEVLDEAGFDACGVDLDDGMLASCREHGLNARCGDALGALRDLPTESMALVSAFHVVEHIPFDEVRALVREALRVLTPGGLLILETPNPENLTVGASTFYVDPSHLRPIPSELLSFVAEHEGFHRSIVMRLQESPQLHTAAKIDLISVLAGVSPDYSVVAQKRAEPELLSALDAPFDANYGITLAAIAHRYEAQEENRVSDLKNAVTDSDARINQLTTSFTAWTEYAGNKFTQADGRFTYLENRLTYLDDGLIRQDNRFTQMDDHFTHLDDRFTHLDNRFTYLNNRDAYLEELTKQLEIRLTQAEHRATQLGEQLIAMHASRSWRITAPLRWLALQARLLRQYGLTARAKALIKKVAKPVIRTGITFINVRPRLRQRSVNLIRRLGLYTTLRKLYFRVSGQAPAQGNSSFQNDIVIAASTPNDLPPRANKIYVGLKEAIERNKESS